MNQIGLIFDATEETPESHADATETPETPADAKPVRAVTGLAEINTETGPVETCSIESCGEEGEPVGRLRPRGRLHGLLQRARATQPVVDPRKARRPLTPGPTRAAYLRGSSRRQWRSTQA